MLRTGLQANAPEAVAAEIEQNPYASAKEISLELLPQYAGDHIFLIVRDDGDDKAAFDAIEKSGIWNNLEAVKNGNVHRLETDKYYGSDIVTIRETMKEALDMLAP
jgi:iron complex transport system substrate-binding protein